MLLVQQRPQLLIQTLDGAVHKAHPGGRPFPVRLQGGGWLWRGGGPQRWAGELRGGQADGSYGRGELGWQLTRGRWQGPAGRAGLWCHSRQGLRWNADLPG